jgi:hypothetical protein
MGHGGLHLLPGLRMNGATPQLPLHALKADTQITVVLLNIKLSSQIRHSELHLVPTLRMSGAILLHPIYAIMAGT